MLTLFFQTHWTRGSIRTYSIAPRFSSVLTSEKQPGQQACLAVVAGAAVAAAAAAAAASLAMSNTGKFADRTPGISASGLTSALANESSAVR